MTYTALKFAYKHPTFGRSNAVKATEPFKNSIYYLWWEFLRRSDAYRKCCESGGKGKLKEIYQDFGDVFASDFKTWWQTNESGAYLFAEQLPPKMTLIDAMPDASVAGQVLVVQVPLALPKRFLAAEFQKLLTAHHSGKRGRRNNVTSTARYPVTGHIDIFSLQKCLRVYDMKIANPKMPLWKITQECKAIKRDAFIDDGDTQAIITNKKLILANTASRLVKKAALIVKNVEQGKFPF
ncbi:hypothetical protein [Limnohabitans sp.]|uniref:hypothetical protein n=1 Tax=Limnohabitans sp. TaxID=1907725 RepID=UPI0038B90F7F